MPPQKLLKLKNYQVHSVTSAHQGKTNANIITWAMQSDLGGTMITIALYKTDLTIELVRSSGIFNLNFLATKQTKLISSLGRKSGRERDKLNKIPHGFDERNCPYLSESLGYLRCALHDQCDSVGHQIFVATVLGQVWLNPHAEPLLLSELREKGLVRG